MKEEKEQPNTDNENNLTVKPVEIDESKFNAMDYGIWTFPSFHIYIGSVAAGKSTLLHNLVTRFLYPIFENRIILFSPTAHNDPLTMDLIENENIFIHFNDYTNETLQRVLEVIAEDGKDNKKDGKDGIDRWLIIFDDILGQLPRVGSREAKFFNKFVSTYRHGAGIAPEGSISCMIFTQKFSDCNNVIRANCSYYNFLGSHSEKHIDQYAEELSGVFGGDDEKFKEIYNEAKTSGKYDFLCLDFRKLRAYKNFDTLLYDRDTVNENNENFKKEKLELEEAQESKDDK